MNNRKRKGNSKSRNNGLKNFAVILVLAAVVGLIIFRITAQPANADSNDTSSRCLLYTSPLPFLRTAKQKKSLSTSIREKPDTTRKTVIDSSTRRLRLKKSMRKQLVTL